MTNSNRKGRGSLKILKPARLAVTAGVLTIAGLSLWLWFILPDPGVLLRHYPVVIAQGEGKEPRIRFSARRPREWVPLNNISRLTRAAIIISEDGKFYKHRGVDLEELEKAIKESARELEFKRGASTISQQLVKNLFLSREKSLIRKTQELILTFQVENLLSKEQILELYLNVIEYGPNLYGIGRASWHYFQKPASDLRAKEGAFLAMLLPNPVSYSSSFRQKRLTPYASRIIRRLLRKMVVLGYLTQEEADWEWQTPLPFEPVETEEDPELTEGDSEAASESELPEDFTEEEDTSAFPATQPSSLASAFPEAKSGLSP